MRALLRLAKGTIIFTVVITGLTGMLMARRFVPPLVETGAILVSLAFSSAASALINNLLDYEMDKKMPRTRWRAELIDQIGKKWLWLIALSMAALSFVPLLLLARYVAAVLTACAILSYTVWYTLYLKRTGPFGAIAGGLPGALPVLIGGYGVSDRFAADIWLLFIFMMFWQPAHFWVLSLKLAQEYAAGGVPVLPVVYGDNYTRLYILIYGLSLPPLALAMGLAGGYGILYFTLSSVASLSSVVRTVRGIYRREQYGKAFFASIVYMLAVMLALTLDILFT
ncbi:MAG: protoheme IX farnesyltransferase [Turneriella sp.]|nr:protoheme IX farnesyltransferase [Turneriella sp.]